MVVAFTGTTKVDASDVRLFNRIERLVKKVDLFSATNDSFSRYLIYRTERDAEETKTFNIEGTSRLRVSRVEDAVLVVRRKWYVEGGEDWF